jgi:rubrerythrin
MDIYKKIEYVETCAFAAKIKRDKENEKPRPNPSVVRKWEDEISKSKSQLEELRKKEAAGIRFICEKCGYEWSVPAQRCPSCGYEDKGFIGNLLARFGF